MKSLAQFCIRFDNPYAIYYSGQQVTGRIYIRLVRPKRMRGIELKCTGTAVVHWTDYTTVHQNGKSRKETEHYWSRESYFENNFFVIGGPNGEITLPPGEHYYPFTVILPRTIPSSFEGLLGHVRYICKGVILRPWRFDHECKYAFTVLDPLDLNLEHNLQESQHSTAETRLGCCCCRSGPISLIVSSKLQGYVPGQKVQAIVEVDNPTSKAVAVKCALIQTATFSASCHACTRTKEVNNPVQQFAVGAVGKRSSLTTPLDLQIPALPASYLRHCGAIHLAYKLRITASAGRRGNELAVDLPIVIGSIPLRKLLRPAPPVARPAPAVPSTECASPAAKIVHAHPAPAPAPAPSAPADPFLAYPELPPPSYEESTSGKANIRSEEDNEFVEGPVEFAPRYPTFTFQQP